MQYLRGGTAQARTDDGCIACVNTFGYGAVGCKSGAAEYLNDIPDANLGIQHDFSGHIAVVQFGLHQFFHQHGTKFVTHHILR